MSLEELLYFVIIVVWVSIIVIGVIRETNKIRRDNKQ